MNSINLVKILALLLAFDYAVTPALQAQDEPSSVRFTHQLLTVDANEGVDIADVNKDGKPDVIAGRNWYPAPDFAPHPLRLIEDWNGYVHSNGDFCMDVDKDGWVDVIAGAFTKTEVYWFKNEKKKSLTKWKIHSKIGQSSILFFDSNQTQQVPVSVGF